MIDAEYISSALNGKLIKNNSYQCDCPVAEHRRAKLIVTDKNDTEPLIHCQAGCSFIDIKTELLARDLWPKKEHTTEERKIIQRRIDAKDWLKSKIWLMAYQGNKDLRNDEDRAKCKKLLGKYKYKIWATKVIKELDKRYKLSEKQEAVYNKAKDILK